MNESKPEDVMKALECCTFNPKCDECPLGGEDCINLDQLAFALLREKDAEIERLHRVSAETNDRNFRLLEATKKSCEARINLAIREAITEFAERLKSNNEKRDVLSFKVVSFDTIDKIAQAIKEGRG